MRQSKMRGRAQSYRLRSNPITQKDIMKHFKRKSFNELEELLESSKMPRSRTPSVISCCSAGSRDASPDADIDHESESSGSPSTQLASWEGTSVNSQTPVADDFDYDEVVQGNSPIVAGQTHPPALLNHRNEFHITSHPYACSPSMRDVCIARPMALGQFERRMFTLRDGIDMDFAAINGNYPEWWEPLDRIVADFDLAQLQWMAGSFAKARYTYGKVQDAVIPYSKVRGQGIALLQLVSYMLSWAAYEVSGWLVQSLFHYLAELPEIQGNPGLWQILRCLPTEPEHASCAIALFQECISKYLTSGQGANSITVLKMNMKLCRHAFAMDDQEPAWKVLREVHALRERHRASIEHIVSVEIDEELDQTLQLFEDRSKAKKELEDAMSACTLNDSGARPAQAAPKAQQH